MRKTSCCHDDVNLFFRFLFYRTYHVGPKMVLILLVKIERKRRTRAGAFKKKTKKLLINMGVM